MSSRIDGIAGTTCLITGGGGYLGQRIAVALLKAGAAEVRSLDVAPLPDAVDDDDDSHLLTQVKRFTGDVRSSSDVCAAMTGCSVVFHSASYGMSGREMLDRRRTRSVNLDGTATVIAAAQTLGVKRLVYTSSYNAVFGGLPIHNGDETLPLFPPSLHVDEYSRTKALAELAVLAANGSGKQQLQTCAIRAAAIYGPGETRHFPRIARLASLGAVVFSIGPPDVRVDWVHGDDLAKAHVLAASKLHRGGPACGQAYFINDGEPVNQTEFLLPLIYACGGSSPRLWAPVWLMIPIAFAIQYFCLFVWWLTRGAYLPSPLLLPAEIYKVGRTHTFSCAKATKDLGYKPAVSQREGMKATVEALMRRRVRETVAAHAGGSKKKR